MNKLSKLLLVLSLPAFLCSCELNSIIEWFFPSSSDTSQSSTSSSQSSSQSSSSSSSTSQSSSSSSSSTSQSSSSSSSSSQTTSSSSSSSSSSQTSEPSKDHYIFHLSGMYLPFSNYGIQINNDASGYNNRDKLLESINEEVGFELVTSLNPSNITIQTQDGTATQSSLHLTIGTGKSAGSIQFNLSEYISKVVVRCSAYYKSWSGGLNVDTEARLRIDKDTFFPPAAAEETPEIAEFEKEYSTSVNTFTLSNDEGGQRVFIESVELFA